MTFISQNTFADEKSPRAYKVRRYEFFLCVFFLLPIFLFAILNRCLQTGIPAEASQAAARSLGILILGYLFCSILAKKKGNIVCNETRSCEMLALSYRIMMRCRRGSFASIFSGGPWNCINDCRRSRRVPVNSGGPQQVCQYLQGFLGQCQSLQVVPQMC